MSKKSNQSATQDRADTFKGNPVRVRKPSKFMGRAGTPDPNSSDRGKGGK